MSTPDDQAPVASAPSKTKKLLTIIAIVVGVIGGGGAGVFMAGPLLAGKLPARSAPAAADSTARAAEGHDEDGKAGAAGAPVHLVENMVLNPANSGGARFLLLSVALAVRDAGVAESMAARDPELRDVILRDMGAREVEELADITRRDSIKVQLRAAIQKRFGKDAVRDVYFPQFVIQ
ncbi:MAG: flagellar basal body-associated FliL family protein [Gemmatimonadaceae bacterium]